MKTRRYKIILGPDRIMVEASRKEFQPSTGQVFFYDGAKVNHIAPANALITCVEDELSLLEEFEKKVSDLGLEARYWKQHESTEGFSKEAKTAASIKSILYFEIQQDLEQFINSYKSRINQ